MSKPNPDASPRPSVSRERVTELRKLVDDARAAGTGVDAMVLHATQHDESILKRSPEISVAELSFVGGEIRFLGVKVVRSADRRSSLQPA